MGCQCSETWGISGLGDRTESGGFWAGTVYVRAFTGDADRWNVRTNFPLGSDIDETRLTQHTLFQ